MRAIFKATNYTEQTKAYSADPYNPEWHEQMQLKIEWHPDAMEPPVLRMEVIDLVRQVSK